MGIEALPTSKKARRAQRRSAKDMNDDDDSDNCVEYPVFEMFYATL
jgi:hypothetical protein